MPTDTSLRGHSLDAVPDRRASPLPFRKTSHRSSRAIAPLIPLVVRVGFAGSRNLFDLPRHPELDAGDLDAQVFDALLNRLGELRAALGLSPHHFLCAVSQIAVGADTLFTRACQTLGLAQRVLLPQERKKYLAAVGTEGPDFTPEERRVARGLLDSPHIIDVHVASHSPDRGVRFEETNTAILDDSDIVICLVREGAGSRRGGSEDLISQAEALGKPVTKITVAIKDGKVQLSPLSPLKEWRNGSDFALPSAPGELSGLVIPALGRADEWPTAESFIAQIKAHASGVSRKRSGWFKRSAVIIIICHLIATMLAVGAGKLAEPNVPFVGILFGVEWVFLSAGLLGHFGLHRSEHARVWAVNRLVAETMRSMAEVERLHGEVHYPLDLPLPDSLVPLLRTCAVLHLRKDPSGEPLAWTSRREAYIERRLTDQNRGQLVYYETQARNAEANLRLAMRSFVIFSSLAIIVAFAEAILTWLLQPHVLTWLQQPHDFLLRLEPLLHLHWLFTHLAQVQTFDDAGNAVAIFLPVAAVGCLSWAAASDLEARAKTFAEMHAFLGRQVGRLEAARSEREFGRLVRETEWRLLGENLNWFWRRSFSSVT